MEDDDSKVDAGVSDVPVLLPTNKRSRAAESRSEWCEDRSNGPIRKKRRDAGIGSSDRGSDPDGAEGSSKKSRKKKKKKRKVFAYGNYDRYYGYRVNHGSKSKAYSSDEMWKKDPRLSVLRGDLFRGKRCLDIGCNAGYMTLCVAKKWNPKHICGIDIDHSLILKAKRMKSFEIQRCQQAEESSCAPPEKCAQAETSANSAKRSIGATGTEYPITTGKKRRLLSDRSSETAKQLQADQTGASTSGPAATSRFPHNVSFQCLNIVATESCPRGQTGTYDTVLCLSVSKWIHLNWGDEGLKRLFRKIYDLLSPGGHFILEPQPWKSYRKKYNVTERTKKHFHEIKMRPSAFDTYLLKTVGFRKVDFLGKPGDCVRGFNRPVYAFRK